MGRRRLDAERQLALGERGRPGAVRRRRPAVGPPARFPPAQRSARTGAELSAALRRNAARGHAWHCATTRSAARPLTAAPRAGPPDTKARPRPAAPALSARPRPRGRTWAAPPKFVHRGPSAAGAAPNNRWRGPEPPPAAGGTRGSGCRRNAGPPCLALPCPARGAAARGGGARGEGGGRAAGGGPGRGRAALTHAALLGGPRRRRGPAQASPRTGHQRPQHGGGGGGRGQGRGRGAAAPPLPVPRREPPPPPPPPRGLAGRTGRAEREESAGRAGGSRKPERAGRGGRASKRV